METNMNNTRTSGSIVTQVSTAIAGLILAGYGLVFIVNAVVGN
jgi:drug/metabolite transporter superfamily protein YnfA